MNLLIDTWNVLHQTGILPPESAGIGVKGLVRMIKGSRWRTELVTLVCDGTPTGAEDGGTQIEIIFTGPYRTADDEIIRRVAESSAARSILVVTSDREIIRAIKTDGAQRLGSADFLQVLVDDNTLSAARKIHRPVGLSQTGVDSWREQFGIDDQTVEELSKAPMPDRITNKQPTISQQPTKRDQKQPTQDKKKHRATTPVDPPLPPDLLEEARRLLDL